MLLFFMSKFVINKENPISKNYIFLVDNNSSDYRKIVQFCDHQPAKLVGSSNFIDKNILLNIQKKANILIINFQINNTLCETEICSQLKASSVSVIKVFNGDELLPRQGQSQLYDGFIQRPILKKDLDFTLYLCRLKSQLKDSLKSHSRN